MRKISIYLLSILLLFSPVIVKAESVDSVETQTVYAENDTILLKDEKKYLAIDTLREIGFQVERENNNIHIQDDFNKVTVSSEKDAYQINDQEVLHTEQFVTDHEQVFISLDIIKEIPGMIVEQESDDRYEIIYSPVQTDTEEEKEVSEEVEQETDTAAKDSVKVFVEEKEVKILEVLQEDTIRFISLRDFFEGIGYEVSWDPQNIIKLNNLQDHIDIYLGNNHIIVNGYELIGGFTSNDVRNIAGQSYISLDFLETVLSESWDVSKTPNEIRLVKSTETEDSSHHSYVNGSGKNVFRPDENISRQEAYILLVRAFEIIETGKAPNNYGAGEIVGQLTKRNITLSNEAKQSLQDTISRGEIASIISQYLDIEKGAHATNAADIANHWAKDSIELVMSQNIMTADHLGLFNPDDKLTRAQVITILNTIQDRKPDTESIGKLSQMFVDLPIEHWAYYDIMESLVNHKVRGENKWVSFKLTQLDLNNIESTHVFFNSDTDQKITSLPVWKKGDAETITKISKIEDFDVVNDTVYLLNTAEDTIHLYKNNTLIDQIPIGTLNPIKVAADGNLTYVLGTLMDVFVFGGDGYTFTFNLWDHIGAESIIDFQVFDGKLYVTTAEFKEGYTYVFNLENPDLLVHTFVGRPLDEKTNYKVEFFDSHALLTISNLGVEKAIKINDIKDVIGIVYLGEHGDKHLIKEIKAITQRSGNMDVGESLITINEQGQKFDFKNIPHTRRPIANQMKIRNGQLYELRNQKDTIDFYKFGRPNQKTTEGYLCTLSGYKTTLQTGGQAETNSSKAKRNNIMAIAKSFHRGFSWNVPAKNVQAKSRWERPKWVQSAGTYNFMPYSWGGNDSQASFRRGVASANGRPGQRRSKHGVLAFTYGLDCSAYVSKAWGIARQTTRNLGRYGQLIAHKNLKEGDIINKAGSHVMIVDSRTSYGEYVLYEATTFLSYDRVVNTVRPANAIKDYKGYRKHGL